MDFSAGCSCRAWWCCGMCAAFVHPVEEHDPQAVFPNAPPLDYGISLAGSNVAVSIPTTLCAPGDARFEERVDGACQKIEPSQSSMEATHQPSNENDSQQDCAIDGEKLKQETIEAVRISQKLGEVENCLKECALESLADDEDICPTCLDGYDSENPRIITACGHHFHLGCILEWAERRPTCPVCDKKMLFDEGF